MERAPDLGQIFRKLNRIALRQESAIFDRKYFVDEHLTESLKTANWQVLYGRRGTGKTTNLLSMVDEINVKQNDSKSIAIYIDLSRTVPSDTGASTAVDAQRVAATKYFQDFIRAFGLKLLELYTDVAPTDNCSNFASERKVAIENTLLEIASFTDKTEWLPQSSAVLDQSPAVDDFENLIGTDYEESAPDSVSTFVLREAGRYATLADRVQNLVEWLELDMLYVLIDEWSSLDKSGKLQIQPLFAELLNRTFKQISRVSLKISAIRATSVFFRKDLATQIGLEPGDDIYEAHDLDALHSSSEDDNRFFESLIYKKLIEADSSILYYSQTSEDGKPLFEPRDGFVRSLFREGGLFDMLVEASGRIPRVFLELFTEIATKLGSDRTGRWTRQNILDEIVSRSIRARQEIERTDRFRGFFKRAVEIARETQQRVFFVSRDEGELFAEIVSDLFHFKVIHNVNSRIIPAEIDRRFRVYVLDFGTFLDATGAYKDHNFSLESVVLSNPCYLDNSERFTVSASEIDYEHIVCPSCDQLIALSHPALQNAGVCYRCYQPVNNVQG